MTTRTVKATDTQKPLGNYVVVNGKLYSRSVHLHHVQHFAALATFASDGFRVIQWGSKLLDWKRNAALIAKIDAAFGGASPTGYELRQRTNSDPKAMAAQGETK